MSVLLGIDAGTGGGRCVALDESGRLVASAERRWAVSGGPEAPTLEPAVVRDRLASAVREVAAALGGAPVEAIGVCAQRTGAVLLDQSGEVLLASPNTDGSGAAHGIALERAHGAAVYRIAGRLPVMLYLPARLARLREERPRDAERVAHALTWADWVVWDLTGEAATEPCGAAELLAFDVAAGTWSGDLCERLGMPEEILPPVRAAGEPAGILHAAAAERLGLPAGIPVVPAGGDTQCAALGAGAWAEGDGYVVAGTTMLAGRVTGGFVLDPGRRTWTSPIHGGGFTVEAHCGEAGALLEWTAALAGEPVAWIGEAAAAAEPGAGGMVLVDSMPATACDFPLVRRGSLSFAAPLLALGRPRGEVARAALEGIAFAATDGLGWAEEAAGPATSVAVAGGVARAGAFASILATALGRPVRQGTGLESARGAAIVAGSRARGGVAAAGEALAAAGADVEPDERAAGAIAAALATWREHAARAAAEAITVSAMMGP